PLLLVRLDRPAIVVLERAGAELLLASAEDQASDVEPGERVADGGRVVLPVDQGDHRHACILAGRLAAARTEHPEAHALGARDVPGEVTDHERRAVPAGPQPAA